MVVKGHCAKSYRGLFSAAMAVSLCVAIPVMGQARDPAAYKSSIEQSVETSATERIDSKTLRAELWGLDASEWQRYQSLMQGIRGCVSPATLSPVEVLGIHARNDDERRRYAEQWAVMMRDDAERILAFQRAYDGAQQRLFAGGLLIDPHALAAVRGNQIEPTKWVWRPDDRVLFFADTQCPTCDAVLERLVSQITQFAGIDVYLVDVAAGDEDDIREWAASKQIDPLWVSEHKMTLNIDGGALGEVTAYTGQQAQQLPLLVVRREGQLAPLPALHF